MTPRNVVNSGTLFFHQHGEKVISETVRTSRQLPDVVDDE